MEGDQHKHFNFNIRDIVIDEIALNGLEGICFDLLWKYIEKRISTSLTTKIKKRFWECIKLTTCISFYQIPEPLPIMEVLDRFMIVDESSGQLLDPPDYLDGPYEYCPVENEHGSCSNYNTRTLLKKANITSMSYEEVLNMYGNNLVMVASFEERWHAIAGHIPVWCITQLTSVHYCILELIAKGRENGQMTIGKSNLTKIVKEPKLLFYNRKQLKKLDLIRVQCVTQVTARRGVKSLLLRLKRFHRCRILSMPKVGKLYNLTEYLRSMPQYTERCDVVMGRGYLTQPECKKLKKTINVFQFSDKYVIEEKPSRTEKNKQDKSPHKRKLKFINLVASDDESSQSDEENNDVQLENQYKVGVNILRQAYEQFLDAGLKGLTQVELGQLIGVEFYTSRTICRYFKAKNIVREFLEDKGRQRTARFIAVAATSEMDSKYAEEREKLLQNFNNADISDSNKEEEIAFDDEIPIPMKKIKLEDINDKGSGVEEIENEILEVKVLDGLQNVNHESLLNPKKNLSLRQLRFANGLFQVMQEKQAVGGYQTLSALVSDKIGEPPMDTKALKSFVQKLVTDRRLKILKIKWPGFHQKYSVLICAANVKSTSPVIRAKYKDICLKSVVTRKSKTKNQVNENITRPLSQFAYPRYMKLQKLHELLVQHAYFDSVKEESLGNSTGVVSLYVVILEMTVELALGNISNIAASDIAHLKVSDDILDIKLRKTQPEIYRTILQSKSMQNSIRSDCKVLNQLGLLQVLSDSSNTQFYVNRCAKIIDTTGTWPRNTTDAIPSEKLFHFKTFDDVKNYWDEVYNISINTRIVTDKRERYNFNVPTRKLAVVESFDNGTIYGDGKGPCGFHSNVYMDSPRLWNTLYLRNSKNIKNKVVKKTIAKTPKENKRRKPPTSKKHVRKPVEEPQSIEKPPKIRNSDANIKWSAHDDETLIICKAAITIMSPNSQAGCLKVKNTVARTLLSLKDPKKTGRICHRRSMLIEPDPDNVHKKDCILNELRRHHSLIQKYEDILRKLKIRFCANMTKYVNEGRLVMLELVWIIYEVLKKGLLANSVACVALDYDDFNKKYAITSSSTSKLHNLYRTSVTVDPEFATLKEGILLTVMHSYNCDLSTKTAKKIYCIFEVYSEEVLRSAIEQLRKSSAMAAKEKVLNNQMNRVQFNDIVRSSFKISACYKRKWLGRLNSEFVDSLLDVIETEVSQEGVKGSPAINCAFFEMHSSDVLDIISVTVPVIVSSSGSIIQEEQLSVIDIEMKFKLKSGIAGWRNKSNFKKFCELYENFEFHEHLSELRSASIVEHVEDQVLDMQDPIVSYLYNRHKNGATFRELQVHIGCDDQTLLTALLNLEHEKIIKRVGYYENRIVLFKFLKPWLFSVNSPNKTYIIPNPWMTLDLEIRHDILFNWAGVLMNKVFECPGCSIAFLSEYFEYITTRSIQQISMFLEKCECVKLRNIEIRKVDLFSDDDYVPEVRELNPYESPENILVFPLHNSLTKFAFLRKTVLNMSEVDDD